MMSSASQSYWPEHDMLLSGLGIVTGAKPVRITGKEGSNGEEKLEAADAKGQLPLPERRRRVDPDSRRLLGLSAFYDGETASILGTPGHGVTASQRSPPVVSSTPSPSPSSSPAAARIGTLNVPPRQHSPHGFLDSSQSSPRPTPESLGDLDDLDRFRDLFYRPVAHSPIESARSSRDMRNGGSERPILEDADGRPSSDWLRSPGYQEVEYDAVNLRSGYAAQRHSQVSSVESSAEGPLS